MFWTIVFVLLILWALGFFAFHISTPLIHLLIVIALAVFVWRLIVRRRIA